MHVSATNGLIGIRIILGHYDAMAHKPKLTRVLDGLSAPGRVKYTNSCTPEPLVSPVHHCF